MDSVDTRSILGLKAGESSDLKVQINLSVGGKGAKGKKQKRKVC